MKLFFMLVYITSTDAFKNILPFYYQIANNKEFYKKNIIKIIVDDIPLSLFKNVKKNKYHLVSDVCPHRGSSLSSGSVNEDCITCAYHGISFNATKSFKTSILPIYQTKKIKDDIFFTNNVDNTYEIYQAPESTNKSFIRISGSRIIDVDVKIVMNNILDAAHISHVHFFSDKNKNPYNMQIKRLDNYSCQSSFNIAAGSRSISKLFQKDERDAVFVENEYHLQSSTVLSRVFINKQIKTVVVNTLPISQNKTKIFWSIYRNFFDFGIANGLIELLFKFLMDYTLDEDLHILKTIYPEHQYGIFNSKYDKIQVEFRKDYEKYLEK